MQIYGHHAISVGTIGTNDGLRHVPVGIPTPFLIFGIGGSRMGQPLTEERFRQYR
jgi:hypothetical protein